MKKLDLDDFSEYKENHAADFFISYGKGYICMIPFAIFLVLMFINNWLVFSEIEPVDSIVLLRMERYGSRRFLVVPPANNLWMTFLGGLCFIPAEIFLFKSFFKKGGIKYALYGLVLTLIMVLIMYYSLPECRLC